MEENQNPESASIVESANKELKNPLKSRYINIASNLVAIVLLIIVLGILIYTLSMVKSDGGQCLRSPIQYGLKMLEKDNPNAHGATAAVSFGNPRYRTLIFNINNITYGRGLGEDVKFVDFEDMGRINLSQYIT